MQLVALKYFVAVVDHGSFQAAAKWLGVSPSTLTRSVSTLEDELGLTLFERSRKGAELATGAGAILAEVRRMLASLETVSDVADAAARGLAGEIRLGVRSPPLGYPQQQMLARWRKDHPVVRLIIHELSDHDIFAELTARRIDVAIVPSFVPWPRIVLEPLYREPMVAALPDEHPLAQRESLKWPDLHTETIFVQDWPHSHAMREYYASMIGIGVPFHAQPASKQSVFSLVAAGFGVTLAMQSQAQVRFPGVTYRRVDEANAEVKMCLAWSPQSECAVIGRFLSSMRAGAADSAIPPMQPL